MERPERRLLKERWEEGSGAAERVLFAVEEGEDLLAARLSLRAGWKLVRQEPSLAAWVVLGELVGGALKLGPPLALLLGWATLSGRYGLDSKEGLLAWAAGTLRWVLDPRTVLGALGLFGVAWASAWVLGVFVQSGVLGALRRRLLAGSWIAGGALLAVAGGALLGAAGVGAGAWGGVGRRVRGAGGAGVGFEPRAGRAGPGGVLGRGGAVGGRGAAGGGVRAGVWGGVALGVVWTHLALGPLILGRRGLWAALGEAALALARRPGEVLGLYAMLGLLYGVVWAVYVPFWLVASAMGDDPRLAVGGLLLRVALDGALLVALALAGVWARAATLSWVALRERVMRSLPADPIPVVAAPAPVEAPALAASPGAAAVSFAALRRGDGRRRVSQV
jgi:hypothetical protein